MALWLVNLAGLLLIGLIIWWFWISRPPALDQDRLVNDSIDIAVENGVYTPPRIEVHSGQSIRLRFLRKDPSPCAEKVIFDQLGLSVDLPLNKTVEVPISLPEKGTYEFTCQMRMYHGELIVKS